MLPVGIQAQLVEPELLAPNSGRHYPGHLLNALLRASSRAIVPHPEAGALHECLPPGIIHVVELPHVGQLMQQNDGVA